MLWHKRLREGWNKTKSFLGSSYQTVGKWAGEMDRAAGIGRKLFSLAVPILDELGAGAAVQGGLKAIKDYDAVRGQVLEADDRIRGHAKRFAQADLF